MEPSLEECIGALHGEGIRKFRIVPVFFGAGGHIKQDLPALVEAIRNKKPKIEISLEPPVGEQPEVISAIARAIAR